MDIQITSRHSKSSPELQETINEKLGKIERFYDKITHCHVVLDSEYVKRTAEIIINIQGQALSAKAKDVNLGKAIDEAVERIESQLKKINAKVKGHKAVRPAVVEEEE